MTVLSKSTIQESVKSGTLGIAPFNRNGLQPASYDMRLHWRILVSPTRHERGREIDLRMEPGRKFAVEPGRFLGVLTKERVKMPLMMAGRFGLRSEFTRHGLISFGGIQIDPGFEGRIAISLFHAGPEPINLVLNSRMFTVEFHNLDTPVDKGYSGQFQKQYDFPKMQREFILNAQTVSLAEINALPDEVASVRQRLAIHENMVHTTRRALTLPELALEQGVRAIDDPNKLLGGWPDDDDFEQFLSTLHTWRNY